MKRALGIAAVGLIGIALAFLVIPTGGTTAHNDRSSDHTDPRRAADGGSNEAEKDDPNAPPDAAVAGEHSSNAPNEADLGQSRSGFSAAYDRSGSANPSPTSSGRAELYSQYEVRVTRQAKVVWSRVKQKLAEADDDASDHTLRRLDILLDDFAAITKQLETETFDELVGRQRIVLTELQQLGTWDPEMKQLADDITAILAQQP